MDYPKSGLIAMSVCAMAASVALAEEKDPTISSVPGNQRAMAQAMKNPVANTPENITKGKADLRGKGRLRQLPWNEREGRRPGGTDPEPLAAELHEPEVP
jgi:nitrogen-specific signal transduction histidine kinase